MNARTVLIIDDDEDFLEWVSTGLSHDGRYRILRAETGKKGLELARAEIPDVAVIDIYLPDSNGFDICKQLKHDAVTAAVSVILVTGVFKDIEALERGYQSGADDFLIKPFSYEQLRVRVLRQLKK